MEYHNHRRHDPYRRESNSLVGTGDGAEAPREVLEERARYPG